MALGLSLTAGAAWAREPDFVAWSDLPQRQEDAMTGSEFAASTARLSGPARQRAAVTEILAGNVPSFERRFVAVRVRPESAQAAAVTFYTLPDYLAIGSDQDFLRIPLTLPSIVDLLSAFALHLPTAQMVDHIYAAAAVKLTPTPMTPGPRMRSSEYYSAHQATIESQRGDRKLGLLTAGHKKDVVVTRRLRSAAERIAIYGWHRSVGDPIQPLSTVHGARYADYSHGVRLVLPDVWLDGEPTRLRDILGSPTLAGLLTREGPIAPRRLLGLTPLPPR